jgi:hypothetical protein
VAPDVAPEEEAFVALVASGTEDEGEAQRRVRAYLCDGESINIDFFGDTHGGAAL